MKRRTILSLRSFPFAKKPPIFGFSRGGCTQLCGKISQRCKLAVSGCAGDGHTLLAAVSFALHRKKKAEFALRARQCLECYGLTEETAQDFNDGPLAHLEELSCLRVLLVAGLADTTVPCEDNGKGWRTLCITGAAIY